MEPKTNKACLRNCKILSMILRIEMKMFHRLMVLMTKKHSQKMMDVHLNRSIKRRNLICLMNYEVSLHLSLMIGTMKIRMRKKFRLMSGVRRTFLKNSSNCKVFSQMMTMIYRENNPICSLLRI